MFVGRESELQRLDQALERARQGNGSFSIVSGETGIGKTALVRQFTRSVEPDNVRYVRAGFQGNQACDWYAPFLAIIQELRGQPFHLPTGLDQPTTAQPEVQGAKQFESLYSVQTQHGLAKQKLLSGIISATRKQPLILELYDVHLASVTAWRFIHYLAENIAENGLILITTLRTGDKANRQGESDYTDILRRMNREGLYSAMHLSPLQQRDVRALLHGLYPRHDFNSHFVPWLLEITKGVPAQLLKCLKGLQTGKLLWSENEIWFCRDGLSKKEMLDTLDANGSCLGPQVLDELADEQVHLLKYMALMACPSKHAILAALTGRARIKTIKNLVDLTKKGVLQHQDDELYQLTEPSVRAKLQEGLSQPEIVSMHTEIAKTLEANRSPRNAEEFTRLADHHEKAENKAAAYVCYHLAADKAVHNFAFLEARGLFERALACWRSAVDGCQNAEKKVQILISLSWLDRMLGDWERSLEHCESGSTLCRSIGNSSLLNSVTLQKGLTHFRLNDWENARSCFQTCLANKAELSNFEQAMANFGLGNVEFEVSNFEVAVDYYQQALELSEKTNARQMMANVFNNLGALATARGKRIQAISFYSKSIPIFQELGDNVGLARVYHNIGMTHAEGRQWNEANRFYGKSLGVSDMMGLIPLKSITFLNRAYCLAHIGQLEDALEYNFKACRLLQRMRDELGLAEYHKIQGVIKREMGEWAESAEFLESAHNKFIQIENKLGCAEVEYEIAILAKTMNRNAEAEMWLRRAKSTYEGLSINQKVKIVEEELVCLTGEKGKP